MAYQPVNADLPADQDRLVQDAISLLVREKRIDAERGQELLPLKWEELLVELRQGLGLDERELLRLQSEVLGIPLLDLSVHFIDPAVVPLIPAETARRYRVLPIFRVEKRLIVALENPQDLRKLDDLGFLTGLIVDPVLVSSADLDRLFAEYLGEGLQFVEEKEGDSPAAAGGSPEAAGVSPGGPGPSLPLTGPEAEEDDSQLEQTLEDLLQQDRGGAEGTGQVVHLVGLLLKQAIMEKASDLHLEPGERAMRVRFRIDGVLRERMAVPREIVPAVTSRVKILARMDIAERRLPQDGHFSVRLRDRGSVDFRVSSFPTIHGEKMVIRVLERDRGQVTLDEVGFEPEALRRIRRLLRAPNGLFIVSGPTGSGKTTTLYSFLTEVSSPEVNVVTLEDPVEYRIERVNQGQTNSRIGFTFAHGLRAILRQDPDIVMVGEIRDRETAQIAIEASLTGHLVFSTLHTNSASQSVTRLVDMGVEPFLVSATLQAVLAQRLARRICEACKEEVEREVVEAALAEMNHPPDLLRAWRGQGCRLCSHTGYRGRLPLFEFLEIGEAVRRLILARAGHLDIEQAAAEAGMLPLRQHGLLLVERGLTSLEEVGRLCSL